MQRFKRRWIFCVMRPNKKTKWCPGKKAQQNSQVGRLFTTSKSFSKIKF